MDIKETSRHQGINQLNIYMTGDKPLGERWPSR